jgi:uncharacterized protein involved in exopolysaccharide biosynthesis
MTPAWITLERVRPKLRAPLLGVLATALLSAAVAFSLPAWYRAETTLLPPQESAESFGLLANLVETSALSKVGLITTTSTSDLFVEILKSRRVREAVIRQFDLTNRYREKNLDECLKRLDEHTTVEAQRSKIVAVSVEDKDPAVAAKMANAMVEELNRVNREVRADRAAQSREFLSAQLAASQNRLRAAEAALVGYERAHGVVIAGDDASAVSGAADLFARKMALEVRRSWMSSYSRSDSPALAAIGSELSAVDRELARLPSIKQEGARKALEVEFRRRVTSLLTAQLEEASIEEQRGGTPLAVLDPARPPTLKARPRRTLIVAISTGVAMLLAGWWVLWRVRAELPLEALRAGRTP